jgi:single-strand DNA-binding protein
MNASTANPSSANSSSANPFNVVVLRGHITSEPRLRHLPSGTALLQLEVTTPGDGAALSVPVAWFDPTSEFAPDDEVTVLGHVRRRFYRAGGTTQSRTEVVADRVIASRRRRDVQRLVDRAVAALGGSTT